MAQDTTQVSQRSAPWMGVGTHVDGLQTAAECIQAAGLDWEVRLEPLYFKTKRGLEVPVADRFATVRAGDNYPLGTVGSHYVPFQNREAFEFFDYLVGDGSATYKAAGGIRGGRQIFIAAELPKHVKFAGDDHDVVILLRTAHDGTRAIGVYVVVMRIKCTNALSAAIAGAKAKWSVPHVSTVAAKLSEAREALQLTGSYIDAMKTQADALANTKLTDKQFETLLGSVLPDRPKTEDVKRDILELRRATPTLTDGQRGTAWGAYNALTEYFDWHRNTRSQEGMMVSVLDGVNARIRNRTFAALVSGK